MDADATQGPSSSGVVLQETSTPARRLMQGRGAARFSGLGLLAAIVVVFGLLIPETFLTTTTLTGILGDQAITAVVALGLLVALSAGAFDLSVGQNLGLSAVACAWLSVNTDLPTVVVVLLVIALGAAIGAVNACLVVVVGVDSFIATLGMSSVLLALTQIVSNSNFIGPLPAGLQDLVSWKLVGLSGVTVIAAALAVVAWVLLEHTVSGRRVAATGANREAARLAGVPTDMIRFTALAVSGAAASAAGAMVAAKTGAVAPTLGPSYLLPAFAACFLSTTQIKPGRFNVVGTVLALLILGTGVTGLQLLGGQLWIANMFTGLALILAVAVAVVGQRRRASAAG